MIAPERRFVLPENQRYAAALVAEGVDVDDVPATDFPRPEEFSEDFADLPFVPVGHYLLPGGDGRTALCNRRILGVPTGPTPHRLCEDCAALAAMPD